MKRKSTYSPFLKSFISYCLNTKRSKVFLIQPWKLHQFAFITKEHPVYCNMMSKCHFVSHSDGITACNDGSMLNVWRSFCPVRHYSVFYNWAPAGGDYVTRRTQLPMSALKHHLGMRKVVIKRGKMELRQDGKGGEIIRKMTRGEEW